MLRCWKALRASGPLRLCGSEVRILEQLLIAATSPKLEHRAYQEGCLQKTWRGDEGWGHTMQCWVAISHYGIDAQTKQLAMFGGGEIGVVDDDGTKGFGGTRGVCELVECIDGASHPVFPCSGGHGVLVGDA